MRYTLLMHYPEVADELDPAIIEEAQRAFASYTETLEAAGVLVSAEVLQPSTNTTTLRLEDGALQVQDGPFADTKDQLGGTLVLDVADLDAAIEWARQAPPLAWGAIEVRPGAVYTVAGAWTPNG
ncbi:YciI family protein [Agromyces bracchium]|uniref:YciI family protein n=1 Tax=Agromyces bracchium TaxID=88376 RepID=A0A6I3M4G5_9MICO|nr:YciI family protein [Agromyces bracchium]MTH67781.1 YciI family protein [Agromyces bracchium]